MLPGDRVLVFDNSLFVDDRSTPTSVTWKSATVICHYGQIIGDWKYESLVDVRFDHRPGSVSRKHIASLAVRSLAFELVEQAQAGKE